MKDESFGVVMTVLLWILGQVWHIGGMIVFVLLMRWLGVL